MIKTKFWLSILAISVVLIAGSLAVSPIAIADDDDDDDDEEQLSFAPDEDADDEELSFEWDPDDSSSDPNNLIVISGSFSRMGLLSDSTTDVSGDFSGKLIGKIKNISETTVTTVAGSTTISTTVNAQSRNADEFNGEIEIDGESFTVTFVASSDPTLLEVAEEFTGPTFNQSLFQTKITIPGNMVMCSDETKCFEGFGIIRREISQTTSGGNSITFATDELEAEVIGDTGLFNLNLSRLNRIVETITP